MSTLKPKTSPETRKTQPQTAQPKTGKEVAPQEKSNAALEVSCSFTKDEKKRKKSPTEIEFNGVTVPLSYNWGPFYATESIGLDPEGPEIVATKINLKFLKNKFALILDNVLSVEECNRLILLGETIGYGLAMGNYYRTKEKNNRRNAFRCIVDCHRVSETIEARLSTFLPLKCHGGIRKGLNWRIRLLKYFPGQSHAPHTDRHQQHPTRKNQVTQITCQMYLSDAFTGGETAFVNPENNNEVYRIPPKPGRVILFDHDILHQGSKLDGGVKYAARLDAFYVGCTAPAKREYREGKPVRPNKTQSRNAKRDQLYR